MENKKKWMRAGTVLFFIVALYLVEAGPWGSRSVALYNGGYGTFDMKAYNAEIVYRILPRFSTRGLNIVKMYYACDYIFIAAFVCLQMMLSRLVYRRVKSPIPRLILNGVAIIRAIMDSIENTLLIYIIITYPILHDQVITIASYFTKVKLGMIPIWGIMMIIGIAFNFISVKCPKGNN